MSDEEQERTLVDYTVEKVKNPTVREADARNGLAVSIENVSVWYSGIAALKDISLDIRAGERIGIIGNNGAGKSTLCDVVTGLTRPVQGQISIDRKDVTRANALKRSKLGMRRVFQHPLLFSDLTIEENIIIGTPVSRGDGVLSSLFVPRLFHKERRNTARQIMEYCNIDEPANGRVEHLPYATKKRIELARALMGNPKILILDEPAASMDDDERAHYCQVVLDYVETFHTTLFVVEHDIEFIRALCQRAAVLDAGELIADGPVLDVLRNREVMSRYYGEEMQ